MPTNPPYYYNQKVFRDLPLAEPQLRGGEAWLMRYSPELDEEQAAWGFLLAPSALRFSRAAEYGEQSSFAAKVRDRQYSQTSGATLAIPNLALMTWYYKKSLMPLIEGINQLLEARVEEGQFSPPLLSFVMGRRRFAPCVLSEVSWDESAWLGGEPASVLMNLTLIEIPFPGLKRDAITPETGDEIEMDSTAPRNELTDRQRKEASDAAKKHLQENQQTFIKVVADKIRSNSYFLETNRETGEVSMLDANKDFIGIVGTYNGQDFNPSSSTIPTE
jgi:hypothetical protein